KPIETYNVLRPDELVGIEVALVEAVLEQTVAGRVAGTGVPSLHGTESDADTGHVEAAYLQLVLESVWNAEGECGSRTLRNETLDRLGGARTIVRTHVDKVLNGLDESSQEVCSRILDRLVSPSGSKIACTIGDLALWTDDGEGRVPQLVRLLEQSRILARIA